MYVWGPTQRRTRSPSNKRVASLDAHTACDHAGGRHAHGYTTPTPMATWQSTSGPRIPHHVLRAPAAAPTGLSLACAARSTPTAEHRRCGQQTQAFEHNRYHISSRATVYNRHKHACAQRTQHRSSTQPGQTLRKHTPAAPTTPFGGPPRAVHSPRAPPKIPRAPFPASPDGKESTRQPATGSVTIATTCTHNRACKNTQAARWLARTFMAAAAACRKLVRAAARSAHTRLRARRALRFLTLRAARACSQLLVRASLTVHHQRQSRKRAARRTSAGVSPRRRSWWRPRRHPAEQCPTESSSGIAPSQCRATRSRACMPPVPQPC